MATADFSMLAKRLRRSEIRELLKLTRSPDMISFGGGLPDPKIFPYEAVESASLRALREQGAQALQYSPTEGDPVLKQQIVDYCSRRGETVTAEELLVVSSSQQSLDLLAKVFIDPGEPVIIERPSYVGALQAFQAFGADLHGVDMDQDGIIPDKLEYKINELISTGRAPRFVYIIPDFQNPSGINLSVPRRKEVLDIASRHNLVIIEDSPYRELVYEGDLLPSLYSLDSDGRVVQLKTFSKVFSPGFRIGWVAAPNYVIDKLVMAKQGTDLCTSSFVSLTAASLMKEGYLEKQIEISKELYSRKAKGMLTALDRYMPKLDGLWWSKPKGGMFLWLHLPDHMDTLALLHEAVKLKVAYVIGTCFYADGSGKSEMRLNYSYPTEEQIEAGIECIAGLVKNRYLGI